MPESIAPRKAVDLYLDDRKAEVTQSTYRNHKYHLRRFLEWCDDAGFDDMSDMDGRRIYEYKNYRRNEGDVNEVTLSNQLSTFRVFLRFCENLEFVAEGTVEKVMMPDIAPGEDARDVAIEADTASEVLDYLSRFEYASLRHALFFLIWHTAMRMGTVHSLDLDDYHSDDHYVEVHHRPETGTTLKNKQAAEREVNLKPGLCEVLDDYISHHRYDVADEYGRKPLFTTQSGRIHKSMIREHIYAATRPCHYTGECPHDRDMDHCEATDYDRLSKCPSNISPHPLRRSAITAHLNEDVPKEIVSDRVDVSADVLDKHYDARTESEKREQRRDYLDDL